MKKFLNKKLYFIIIIFVVCSLLAIFLITRNKNSVNKENLIDENINAEISDIEDNDNNINNIAENTMEKQSNIIQQEDTKEETKNDAINEQNDKKIETQKIQNNEKKETNVKNKQETFPTTTKSTKNQNSATSSKPTNNQQISTSNNTTNNQQDNKTTNNSGSKKDTEEQPEKCKRGQHFMDVGNCGKWFNSHSECEAYYDKIVKEWNDKFNNGEITYEEYLNKCPTSFEDFSCMYCGKYTMNIYYRK